MQTFSIFSPEMCDFSRRVDVNNIDEVTFRNNEYNHKGHC
jgi:hypothetical protein